MSIIINAGSENKGGTFEQALINANCWFKNIKEEYPEVEMSTNKSKADGMFDFIFTHGVTKKQVVLSIHGFTDKQCDEFTFSPRVYWNGSSTAEPKIEDWLADGFNYRIVYEKIKD